VYRACGEIEDSVKEFADIGTLFTFDKEFSGIVGIANINNLS
jgi:hypothetical protein